MRKNKNFLEKTLSFNLPEISKWQLEYENSNVELPALQRSFVWKVNQIESLWDSILRGFPIGSFLLSRSEDDKLFLLDGQQRATSIALGFYNPWLNKDNESNNFWSLKNIPVVWLDLVPTDKTNTQKFVIRVVTQSHPWGYQRRDNSKILTVSDRRNALQIFNTNKENKDKSYVQLSSLNVFPYDSDLPVPLSFIIKSVIESKENWKVALIKICEEHLSNTISTKHNWNIESNYFERLSKTIYSAEFDDSILDSIMNVTLLNIPGIVVNQESLKSEDEGLGEDPTLFVRLNSSGTRIAGEELIYSIYKASFPEAKMLVENIGTSFVAPSLVISFVARLAWSDLNENSYPSSINVNDFRRRIKDEKFKNKVRFLIGDEEESPARNIFNKALEILLSSNQIKMPPVLIKSMVKGSPELFLMILQWVKIHEDTTKDDINKKILAVFTALSWFGTDNSKYVREIWDKLSSRSFWYKENVVSPFFKRNNYIMYPLIHPEILRTYLVSDVVGSNVEWDNLYPDAKSEIYGSYSQIIDTDEIEENAFENANSTMWENFMNKLFWCKPLVLFAQRKYINEKFDEFNQMDTLEDTNTPWDWDHIYPISWVHKKQYIDHNTRRWSSSIGNFRALSLEENRSENNLESPSTRLTKVRLQSFVKDNDFEYWEKITQRINKVDHEMIKVHLSAIIHRLCNIYEEWYLTLEIGELFEFQSDFK